MDTGTHETEKKTAPRNGGPTQTGKEEGMGLIIEIIDGYPPSCSENR
jgi:hypothetical protein